MTKMNWARVHTEDRQRRYWRKRRRVRVRASATPPRRHRGSGRSRHVTAGRHRRRNVRSCPYCGVTLNPKNYDRHTTSRCPNRPGPSRARHEAAPGVDFTTAAHCDICSRTVPARDANAHFDEHREQWRATGAVVPIVSKVLKRKRQKGGESARQTNSVTTRHGRVAADQSRRGDRADQSAIARTQPTGFALCVDARRRRFLEKGKLYQVRPGSNLYLRVWDDSGYNREYPTGLFVRLKIPRRIQRLLEPSPQ